MTLNEIVLMPNTRAKEDAILRYVLNHTDDMDDKTYGMLLNEFDKVHKEVRTKSDI